MPSVRPSDNAFVLDGGEIMQALGIPAPNTVEIADVAGRYRVTPAGAEFVIRFVDTPPASVIVRVVPPAGGAATNRDLDVVGFGARGGGKPIDPIKPFLLAVAGIIVSAVAILAAAFAGLSSGNKDFEKLFSQVAVWMAAVVVVATLAAILLQAIRVVVLSVQRRWGGGPSALATVIGLILGVGFSLVPLVYGYFAAYTVIQNGMVTLGLKPEDMHWLLRLLFP